MTLEVLFTVTIGAGNTPLNNPDRYIVETDSWDKCAQWAENKIAQNNLSNEACIKDGCPTLISKLEIQCIRPAACKAIFLS